MMTLTTPALHMRWTIARDIPAILPLLVGLTQQDIVDLLALRDHVGMTLETGDGRLVGFCLYQLHNRHLEVVVVACQSDDRPAVVRRSAEFLCNKLKSHRRARVLWDVPETDLPTLRACKAAGLEAIDLKRGEHYDTIRMAGYPPPHQED